MKKANLGIVGCLIVSAFVLSSCGISLKYSSSGIDKADPGPKPLRIVAVDLMDTRTNNTTPIVRQNPADDLADLRISIREHLETARIVQDKKEMAAAPESIGQIETILGAARKQGVDAVLFLRLDNASVHGQIAGFVSGTNMVAAILTPVGGIGLLPLIIVNSISVNDEGAHVVVEAVLIDPKTNVLLGRFVQREDYDDKVSGWSFSPHGAFAELVKKAVQKNIVAVADASKAGFPGRAKRTDLKAILASASLIDFHPDTGLVKTSEMQKGKNNRETTKQ